MTVSYVVVVASRGGTSCEWSIAHDRRGGGDLRRREPGRECGAGVAGHVDGAARLGGVGQPHGATFGPGRWRTSGPPGVVAGRDDSGGWVAHRSRGRAARRCDAAGVAVPGDGSVAVGD